MSLNHIDHENDAVSEDTEWTNIHTDQNVRRDHLRPHQMTTAELWKVRIWFLYHPRQLSTYEM